MRQKLFTKQIDDMLFKQYAMGNDLSKQKVVAKIFNPYGRGVWYLLNSDPSDPDYIWAIVDLFEVEVGSVSRESLETMKVPPFGLNLERDMYFQPINASELLSRLYQGETFANGGKVRGYKIYHDTLAQTLQEAEDFFHNEGYLFTSDNYFPDVTVGGVGYGETARITRPIQLQGKSKEGVANIQIYRMDSGKYELNMYPSYADGGEMDSMSYAKTKGKESIDWDKELREYAGSNYSKLSEREKEEMISDMQKDFDRNYFADGGIVTTYAKMLNELNKEKQFNKKIDKKSQLDRFAKSNEITIDNNNIIYVKGERYGYIDKINQKTGQEKSNWELKKFADGGELQIIKNESGENYLASVNSTPNEMAVKLANGGYIPNNYRGRTTEDIWNSLTENQRVHFMFDHFDELGVEESEIVDIANQEFQDLNEDVQDAFKRHTMMGQYADGGFMAKGGQVSGYFVFRPYKLEGNFYVNTTIQNELPNSVIMKGLEGKLKGNDYNSAENIAHNIMQNHPEIAKLDIVKLGATTLKNKKVATFERNDSGEYQIEYFADGGMTDFPSISERKNKTYYHLIWDDGKKVNDIVFDNKAEAEKKYDSLEKQSGVVAIHLSKESFSEYGHLEKHDTYRMFPKFADGGMTDRDLNLYAQKRANELGVTRKDLGYDYSNALAQALVEGLTDANSHSEVRQLISILEKRPEWAKDPYADKSSVPEFGSPQYSEWRDNSVYSSMYYDADDNVRELGIDVSQKSGYDGYGIAMAFKYVAQMNGEQKLASNIDKVFGGKMAKGGIVVTKIKDIPNFKQRLDEGKITYRGLGTGKLYNDFYDKAGESGTRIKVDGKEYYITDTEFNTFSRGSDGKLRIKFDAPQRKGYAKGGTTTFNDKVKSISKSLLKRKKVAPSVQKDYGKTYDKKEAIESAKRIAGAIRKKTKMSKGGMTDMNVIVKTPKGLVTKKDFEGFSKKEIIEWCEQRGWKYNNKAEKLGGRILKEYEFFIKTPTKYNITLPKKKS